jgi:hypothetical protein
MARRELTREEEKRLAAGVEQRKSGDPRWDFDRPRRVRVPSDATGVLSVRVPAGEFAAIRERARAERVSTSEFLKRAVESYVAQHGPDITQTQRGTGLWLIYSRDASPTESSQPGARQVRDASPSFVRPSDDKTVAS